MGFVIDLFAGGGGASLGIEAAIRRAVDVAINHDATALAVHQANHPHTLHLTSDIWDVKPLSVAPRGMVDILWASPDCTHFSVAKGGKPRKQNIRSLAWIVTRWASDVRPKVIFLENVAEFQGWGPLDEEGRPDKVRKGETFKRWKRKLEKLGYVVDFRVLDASHYGAPTKRRRLFLVARCDGLPITWPKPTHGEGLQPVRTAAECIDWSIPCPSIFERKRPLAEKTLKRIALGIQRFVLDSPQPFIVGCGGRAGQSAPTGMQQPIGTITAKNDRALVVPSLIQTGYGERKGQAPRVLDLHQPMGTIVAQGTKQALVAAMLGDQHAPMNRAGEVRAFLTSYYGSVKDIGQPLTDSLRTVTTKDRFGLVTVSGVDYQIVDIGMRMLEPEELLRAQFGRFAANYDMRAAKTKTAKVRLIGNSVCPEAAEAVVAANLPARMMHRAA